MKRFQIILVSLFILFSVSSIFSLELTSLSTAPTAGILQKGNASIDAKLFGNDGVMLGTQVGLVRYFMFGVSYSGENIIGSNVPSWQDRVEFIGKYRFKDETERNPAFTIGFDSQGSGRYDSDKKRYDIKSKGFFIVGSKNYIWNGDFGTHLGLNYSLENEDDDDINIFLGFDKSIGKKTIFICDYDVGINDYEYGKDDQDKSKEMLGKGKGYLNASIIFKITPMVKIKIAINDILANSPSTNKTKREILLSHFIVF